MFRAFHLIIFCILFQNAVLPIEQPNILEVNLSRLRASDDDIRFRKELFQSSIHRLGLDEIKGASKCLKAITFQEDSPKYVTQAFSILSASAKNLNGIEAFKLRRNIIAFYFHCNNEFELSLLTKIRLKTTINQQREFLKNLDTASTMSDCILKELVEKDEALSIELLEKEIENLTFIEDNFLA